MKIISKDEFNMRCIERQALTPQKRQELDRDLFIAVQDVNPLNQDANLAKIAAYLKAGASPNTRDPETGKTPMTAVATKSAAALLIEGRGSLTAKDKNGHIGLVAAIDQGYLELAQTFLQVMVSRPLERLEPAARVALIKETLRDNLYMEVLEAGGRALKRDFSFTHAWVRHFVGGEESAQLSGFALLQRQASQLQGVKPQSKHVKRPLGRGGNFLRTGRVTRQPR